MRIEEANFAELLSGIVDNRGRTCPTAEDGVPLIATNCIRNDALYPVFERVRFVDEETYRTWFRGHPQPGDLIFVCKGSPGRVCMTPDPVPFCIAQDMVAIRADDKLIYPKYLFAALRSPVVQERIAGLHVGSLIPHFKKGDFDKLSIPVPDRDTQVAIGDSYFDLSLAMELNRRTTQTCEKMARALFRAWFVDFEPVKAKAEGADGFPGMPQQVFNQLPERLNETAHGAVPAGWSFVPIGDLVDVVGGATPSTKTPTFWDGGDNAFCTPKDMSRLDSPVLLDTERHITQAGVDKISSGQLPAGAVLLSSRAPIGYLALAATPVSVNQGIIAMKTGAIPNSYVLLWTEANMDVVKSRAGGSTFAEISKRNFRPIPALRPDDATLHAFGDATAPLFEMITVNERETQALARTRDALLPALINGNVRLCR